jgi:hypothetical protein
MQLDLADGTNVRPRRWKFQAMLEIKPKQPQLERRLLRWQKRLPLGQYRRHFN